MCAVEDLQWIAPAVTTLHKRISAGATSARPKPYLPPAVLVILVENAIKSKFGPLLKALANRTRVRFLRFTQVVTTRVADIVLPAAFHFCS